MGGGKSKIEKKKDRQFVPRKMKTDIAWPNLGQNVRANHEFLESLCRKGRQFVPRRMKTDIAWPNLGDNVQANQEFLQTLCQKGQQFVPRKMNPDIDNAKANQEFLEALREVNRDIHQLARISTVNIHEVSRTGELEESANTIERVNENLQKESEKLKRFSLDGQLQDNYKSPEDLITLKQENINLKEANQKLTKDNEELVVAYDIPEKERNKWVEEIETLKLIGELVEVTAKPSSSQDHYPDLVSETTDETPITISTDLKVLHESDSVPEVDEFQVFIFKKVEGEDIAVSDAQTQTSPLSDAQTQTIPFSDEETLDIQNLPMSTIKCCGVQNSSVSFFGIDEVPEYQVNGIADVQVLRVEEQGTASITEVPSEPAGLKKKTPGVFKKFFQGFKRGESKCSSSQRP